MKSSVNVTYCITNCYDVMDIKLSHLHVTTCPWRGKEGNIVGNGTVNLFLSHMNPSSSSVTYNALSFPVLVRISVVNKLTCMHGFHRIYFWLVGLATNIELDTAQLVMQRNGISDFTGRESSLTTDISAFCQNVATVISIYPKDARKSSNGHYDQTFYLQVTAWSTSFTLWNINV